MENKTTFADLIKQARARSGLSMQKLADFIGKSQTTIYDMEKGNTVPHDITVLQQLSNALDLPLIELCLVASRDRRCRWVTENEVSQKVEALFDVVVESAWMPEPSRIENSDDQLTKVNGLTKAAIHQKAENLAKEVFGISVTKGMAVNVMGIYDNPRVIADSLLPTSHSTSKNQSIELETFFFDKSEYDGAEGVTIKTPRGLQFGLRKDVAESARKGNGRARFTAAHELGHVILHGRQLLESDKTSMHRTPNVTATEQLDEQTKIYESPEWQANAFASAFLMPYEPIKDFINMQRKMGNYSSGLQQIDLAETIAETLQVSFTAAYYRVEQLMWRVMNELDKDYQQTELPLGDT